MTRVRITYRRAKELFRYDPKTGKLYWKKRTSCRIKVGDEVGNPFGRGKKIYLQTSVDGQKMLVHRIIWLLCTKKMPKFEVGHADHNGLNNKWNNLDDVTSIKNNQNLSMRSDNTSGFLGVTKHSQHGGWVAQAQLKGKYLYLGYYPTKQQAIAARKKANPKYGFHTNHGRK